MPKISPMLREFLLSLELGEVDGEVLVGNMDSSGVYDTSLVLIFNVL